MRWPDHAKRSNTSPEPERLRKRSARALCVMPHLVGLDFSPTPTPGTDIVRLPGPHKRLAGHERNDVDVDVRLDAVVQGPHEFHYVVAAPQFASRSSMVTTSEKSGWKLGGGSNSPKSKVATTSPGLSSSVLNQ